MIITDNETKVDLLNNEAIATTIIRLLRKRPDLPVTVGIHGDWGAGKSSIHEMIETALSKDEKVLCIKFNGWRYQGFEDAKIALIEGIVTGLLDKRPGLKKTSDAAGKLLKRIDWLKAAKKAGGLAFTAFTGIPTPDQIQSIASALRNLASNPAELATPENIQAAAGQLDGLIKPAEAIHVLEEIKEFRKEFEGLVKDAKIDQLVVLVDDLDRCLPSTTIQTLEAIRLFVFTDRTAFVIAADEAMIEYAVKEHFPDLPATEGPADYARNYLEKLIQVPFRIPSLGVMETRTYITLLLIGAAVGEEDEAYKELIDEARERLKRPWVNATLDAATVRNALGDKASTPGVNDAITLSDQIGPILAGGTKGNPRQIKRFLNVLLLRKQIAEARGFGEDIKLPILAKLMLAERFSDKLFDRIASEAANNPGGICPDLKMLEASAEQNDKSADSKEGEKKGTNSSIEPFSEADRAWAALEPKLEKVDLRPYLFVAKDKKDYFIGTAGLGKLEVMARQLMGKKISVQGMIPQLKILTLIEAEQLFEETRSGIMGSGEYETQPKGIDGLIALLTAQPSLQPQLFPFLDSLPTNKLGSWVVQGWGNVIKDPKVAAQFEQLLTKWSNVTGNKPLSLAAKAALGARSQHR